MPAYGVISGKPCLLRIVVLFLSDRSVPPVGPSCVGNLPAARNRSNRLSAFSTVGRNRHPFSMAASFRSRRLEPAIRLQQPARAQFDDGVGDRARDVLRLLPKAGVAIECFVTRRIRLVI